MLGYEDVRNDLIQHLLNDAKHHEDGYYMMIGEGYPALESDVYNGKDQKFEKLQIAMTFWDSWQDARNHEWRYYKGITKSDWPVLARRITDALAADKDITDALIIKHFVLTKHEGFIQKIRSLFK